MNPEFRKHAKLELTPLRLLLPLVVLLLGAWAGWVSVTEIGWENLPLEHYKGESLLYWTCSIGFIFTILWGTYLCTSTITEEVSQKSWTFMELSPLSTSKILFGKLFGSTITIWIITLFFGIPILAFAVSNYIPDILAPRNENITITMFIAGVLLWIVATHAFAFFTVLGTLKLKLPKSAALAMLIPVIIVSMIFGGLLLENINDYTTMHHKSNFTNYNGLTWESEVLKGNNYEVEGDWYRYKMQDDNWYDFRIPQLDKITLLIAFIAFWSIIGSYRILRETLQYKDTPWVWFIFMITAPLFLSGVSNSKYEQTLEFPLYMMNILLLLVCAKEAGDIIAYKTWIRSIKEKSWKQALKYTPLWLISFMVLALYFLFLFVYSPLQASFIKDGQFSLKMIELYKINSALIVLCCALKDILAFHIIFWWKKIRRPLIGVVVYLLIAYVIAPVILHTLWGQNASFLVAHPIFEIDYSIKNILNSPLLNNNTGIINMIYWSILGSQILVFGFLFNRIRKSTQERLER
ncbi:MAG: hypothetical protein KDJ50_04215 [Alphaproteobacteria bacterium]|nr:hypothetical protein [Alphaproteobacteria bacterium]